MYTSPICQRKMSHMAGWLIHLKNETSKIRRLLKKFFRKIRQNTKCFLILVQQLWTHIIGIGKSKINRKTVEQ